MNINIFSFSNNSSEEFNLALDVRFKVFTDEMNIHKDKVFDGLDFEATQFLVTVDDQPAASARFRELKEGMKIEKLCVLKDFRSLAIGTLLLRYIIKELLPSKEQIFISVPDNMIEYFKFNGFTETDEFIDEMNVQQRKMIYTKVTYKKKKWVF
jgi:GNAT superfamily N-acetyltransferase